VVIEKDDQGKPDVGKSLLAAAYSDDKADIAVGPTARAWRWPCCRWPRNTRRSCWSSPPWPIRSPATSGTATSSAPAATAARTPSANAVAHRQGRHHHRHAGAGLRLRPRRRQGLQGCLKNRQAGARGIPAHQATTDFTAGAQRLIDKLKDQPGRKIIWIIWAGAGNPFKIADLDLKRYGIEIATGGNILPAMASYKNFPGMEGATYYYFGIPKNP
jgi:branched-chain amino acid transport system substrate-binding protein